MDYKDIPYEETFLDAGGFEGRKGTFYADGGASWKVNWIMDFSRI